MAAARVTITIDEETLAELKERVGPGEVSAFVVEALRHKLRIDPIKELLRQLDERYGPLTEQELKDGAEWYDQAIQRLSSTLEQSSD
jgi:Arc/MetJ family transcription regulator